MASKTVVMTNPTGLHTRPGGVFVAKAKEFESDVFVEHDGKKVNGKSLLKLLYTLKGQMPIKQSKF